MAERKPFLLRIDREVLDAVQRWADDDLRSLNAQIEFLLRRVLAGRGPAGPALGPAARRSAAAERRQLGRGFHRRAGRQHNVPAWRSRPSARSRARSARTLRDRGYLAAVLVDLSALAQIERSFGGAAFRSLREQVDPLLEEMRERFRQDDLVTRDEREGDRFLLFLSAAAPGGHGLPLRGPAQAGRPDRGVPDPARRPAHAAVPARAAGARRRLRARAVEPAREPRAPGAAADRRRDRLRRDARAPARARRSASGCSRSCRTARSGRRSSRS